MDILLNFDI